MSRIQGSKNKGKTDFARQYETLVLEEGVNPLRVLFKLCKSRTQSIRLQAAKEVISYRYPKQATATLELEAAGQMVMSWEETRDLPPPVPIDITPDPEQLEASVLS